MSIPGTVFPTWQRVLSRRDVRSSLRWPPGDILEDEDYLLALLKDSAPHPRTIEHRRSVMSRLEHCIQRKYGTHYVLSIFGSSAYGLDSDTTDLDLCIVDTRNTQGGLPNFSTDGTPYNLGNLAHRCIAQAGGFVIKRVIRNANTPIVILEDVASGIPIDINVNCLAGNYNTLFISSHVDQSPTFFLPLANFLKIWARNRSLSSSSLHRSESISSYTLVLLLLTYLVQINAVHDLLDPDRAAPRGGWVNEMLTVPDGDVDNHWRQMFAMQGSGQLGSYHMGETLQCFFS